jgi:cytochrome c553
MVDHGLMRSISVTDPSQVRPARLLCALCHGRGGSHQGHGTPELIVSMGGNE